MISPFALSQKVCGNPVLCTFQVHTNAVIITVYHLVMVVTGYPYDVTTEVVDVEDPNISCDNLPDFPTKLSKLYSTCTLSFINFYFHNNYFLNTGRATGGLVKGTPIVCGGYDGSSYHDECYIFDKIWQELARMSVVRKEMASVVVNDALWVAAGETDSGPDLKLTEHIYVNGTIIQGMWPMPSLHLSIKDQLFVYILKKNQLIVDI